MAIYTGQRIPLSTFFKKASDGSAIDITGATIRYDYWLPGNPPPNARSGFVLGIVVDGPTGESAGNILASLNTLESGSGNWIIQANAIIGEDEWPEIPKKFKVLPRGKI